MLEKERLEQEVPCFTHKKVQEILSDPSLTIPERAKKIYIYAFNYASMITNGKPVYPVSASYIEVVLFQLASIGDRGDEGA